MTRYIRLREWGCNLNVYKNPSDALIYSSDGLSKDHFHLRTDVNGFIATGNDAAPMAPSIVILGDSIVENLFVHEEYRMCSVLERTLRDALGPVNVLNAGMTGASMLHLLNILLNKVLPMKPLAVVLLTGAFDMTPIRIRNSFWSTDTYVAPIVEHGMSSTADTDLLENPDFMDREKLLLSFVDVLRTFNVPLYASTIAHRTDTKGAFFATRYGSNQSAFDQSISSLEKINAQTRAICVSLQIPLLDLERELMSESELFYDQFHLNRHGSNIYAQKLAHFLSKNSDKWLAPMLSKIEADGQAHPGASSASCSASR